jgi:hypothetical protein
MVPSTFRQSIRAVLVCALLLLPVCATGCGTGGDGNRASQEFGVGGGSLPPSRAAYSLTNNSELFLTAVANRARPDWVDLRRDGVVPPIQNQRWNSCVGWSMGYYLMTALEARHQRIRGGWLDMQQQENWFSPDYIYSQRDTPETRERALAIRAAAGDPVPDPVCFELDGELGCMRPEVALGIVVSQGCCRWPWLCRDGASGAAGPCTSGTFVDDTPSRVAHYVALTGAHRHRARCYVRFGELADFRQRTYELMQD